MRKLPLLLSALVAVSAVPMAKAMFPELRATPFYDIGKEHDPERVNLWPLVYAQFDRTSAFFNFYSHSDEHVAFHPLFSVYRDGRGGPFTSYNTLFGLYHWDTGSGASWLPPYFSWRGGHMLFPLWINTESGFYSWLYADSGKTKSIPLLLSWYDDTGSWCSLPLLTGGDDDGFLSLPLLTGYSSRNRRFGSPIYYRDPNTWAIPLLLTWMSDRTDRDLFVSVPLLSWWRSCDTNSECKLLMGLLYGYTYDKNPKGGEKSFWFSLPLLTGRDHSVDRDGNEDSHWFSAPLLSGGSSQVKRNGDYDNTFCSIFGTYYHRDLREARFGKHDHTYRRYAILWKFWDWREEDGDISLDSFPGITYDRKRDGSESFSFLWRLYRFSRDAQGKRKFDLFYIPIIRD